MLWAGAVAQSPASWQPLPRGASSRMRWLASSSKLEVQAGCSTIWAAPRDNGHVASAAPRCHPRRPFERHAGARPSVRRCPRTQASPAAGGQHQRAHRRTCAAGARHAVLSATLRARTERPRAARAPKAAPPRGSHALAAGRPPQPAAGAAATRRRRAPRLLHTRALELRTATQPLRRPRSRGEAHSGSHTGAGAARAQPGSAAAAGVARPCTLPQPTCSGSGSAAARMRGSPAPCIKNI